MRTLNEKLKQKQGCVCSGPAASGSIDAAEQALSLLFAEEYRQYTAELGCVSYVGHELTGVCSIERLNVVNVTKRAREHRPDVPVDFYVVEETHMDGIVIWQNSEGAIFRTSPTSKLEKIFNSMEEYIDV